jgi:hypothetical protein
MDLRTSTLPSARCDAGTIEKADAVQIVRLIANKSNTQLAHYPAI